MFPSHYQQANNITTIRAPVAKSDVLQNNHRHGSEYFWKSIYTNQNLGLLESYKIQND